MYITAKTLDDLMHQVLERLLKQKKRVAATRGGNVEIVGILLKLSNPLARLSRSVAKGTVFSCLGELLWYLSKSNDLGFIKYYLSRYGEDSDDGETVYGGYGPRLFKMHGEYDQVQNLLNLLKEHRTSRRAVIQLFDAGDIAGEHKKEIPCTCTLQFMIRSGRLEMLTSMRSNDAYFGLPHDIFAFTMLQEILARTLNVEVGIYRHAVGSLHLYENKFEEAKKYIDEGFQRTIPMHPMPLGDPWDEIRRLQKLEELIRTGGNVSDEELKRPGYWGDLVRLLGIFSLSKKNENRNIASLKKLMSSKYFHPYIQRKEKTSPHPEILRQLDMFNLPPK